MQAQRNYFWNFNN